MPEVFRIKLDGSVELTEGKELTDAARAFWQAVSQMGPTIGTPAALSEREEMRPEQVGEVQGVRDQFEAWAATTGHPVFRDTLAGAKNADYLHGSTRLAWRCWQAALAARQPGVQVPVGVAYGPISLPPVPHGQVMPPDDRTGLYPVVHDDEAMQDYAREAMEADREHLAAGISHVEGAVLIDGAVHLVQKGEEIDWVRGNVDGRKAKLVYAAPTAQGIDLGQQQDAARWRWVREQNGVTVSVEEADDDGDMAFVSGHAPEELDAAIDGQRDAAPGPSHG